MCATKRAVRPFFKARRTGDGCAFIPEEIEFEWHSGLSWQVRQRSSKCLADAILEKYQAAGLNPKEILEVSTASEDYETGQALSAINLQYEELETGRIYSVENWFQAAKVFEDGNTEYGPYKELLDVKSPKRYLNLYLDKKTAAQFTDNILFQRIQQEIRGANLVRFELGGKRYPLVPRSCFYDFLYVRALCQDRNADLAKRLCNYRVFTDIMFTPGTGKRRKFNTQARSCAIYVSLTKRELIDIAVEDIDSFIDVVGYPSEDKSADLTLPL